MNKLFRQIGLMLILLVAISLGSCTSKYSYETVPNDPLKARIYTLDNGLKVYMTVNKETPRIQTYIAVRVGGKNDPAETTGLAHYFEHLMFKGTINCNRTGKHQPCNSITLHSLKRITHSFHIHRIVK